MPQLREDAGWQAAKAMAFEAAVFVMAVVSLFVLMRAYAHTQAHHTPIYYCVVPYDRNAAKAPYTNPIMPQLHQDDWDGSDITAMEPCEHRRWERTV